MIKEIYNVYKDNTTPTEKEYLLITTFLYGNFVLANDGMPYNMQKPNYLCASPSTDSPNYQQCSIQDACSSNFLYQIDYETSPKSLVTQFNLTCENQIIITQLMTIVVLTGLLATVMMSLINVTDRFKFLKRMYCLQILFIILALKPGNNVYLISFLIGMSFNFSNNIQLSNIYVLSYQNLNPKINQIYPAIVNCFFSLCSCTLAYVEYISNSNWRLIMIINGSVQIYLIYRFFNLDVKQTKQCDVVEQSKTVLNQSVQINEINYLKSNKQIRFNFYQQILESIAIRINDVYLIFEIQSFGGNMYLNIFCLSMFEFIGGILSMSLMQKYDVLSIKKYQQIIILSLGLTFILKNEQTTGFLQMTFIVLAMIMKALTQMQSNAHITSAINFLPIDIIPFFYKMNMLVVGISATVYPYFSYYVQNVFGINTMFILALNWLLIFICSKYKQDISLDNQDQFIQLSSLEQDQLIDQFMVMQMSHISNANLMAVSYRNTKCRLTRLNRNESFMDHSFAMNDLSLTESLMKSQMKS